MFDDLTEKRDDIVSSILDGSRTVNTVEEFEEILQTDPENPSLLRAYADFLVGNTMFDEAAVVYKKSAGLFAKSAAIVQAMLSTILHWGVIKVSERECRSIYSALHDIKSEEVPAFDFFTRMTYSELIAVMGELEHAHFSPGHVLREPNDPEYDIFFIVSGLLRETVNYQSTAGGLKQFTATLAENMFFGDVYPLEEETLSPSRVETITDVQLLRFSKPDIMRVCRIYPNIRLLLMDLCQTRRGSESRQYSRLVRATRRYQLQTKVTLEIFPNEKNESPIILKCITDNVSEGGACINLGEKYWIGSAADLVGRKAKMMINVPKASLSFEVTGDIVWKKEVSHDEATHILVGIQFTQISEEDFNFLKKYCYVGDGEQDMIYSLWESYVKK
jgi:CRP-like cAMP-binding protein